MGTILRLVAPVTIPAVLLLAIGTAVAPAEAKLLRFPAKAPVASPAWEYEDPLDHENPDPGLEWGYSDTGARAPDLRVLDCDATCVAIAEGAAELRRHTELAVACFHSPLAKILYRQFLGLDDPDDPVKAWWLEQARSAENLEEFCSTLVEVADNEEEPDYLLQISVAAYLYPSY